MFRPREPILLYPDYPYNEYNEFPNCMLEYESRYLKRYSRMKYISSGLVQEVILYSVGGAISFWLTFALLSFFTDVMNMHYLISLTFGYVAGFVFNFWFQDKITFRAESFTHRELVLFFIVQSVGLILLQGFTLLLTEQFRVFYKMSFFIASLIVAFITFSGSKFFVFREKKNT